MMYFQVFSASNQNQTKFCGSPCGLELDPLDEPLTTSSSSGSRMFMVHVVTSCPGMSWPVPGKPQSNAHWFDRCGEAGSESPAKLVEFQTQDVLEILESKSGSVVVISTTLHFNALQSTSINHEEFYTILLEFSPNKTRSSCGRETHENDLFLQDFGYLRVHCMLCCCC